MQAHIARQIEAVWSLADVATFHGQASFRVEGNDLLKRIECFGMRLDFINDELVRLRHRNLDVNVTSAVISGSNVTPFPLTGPRISFAQGNEEMLDALHREIGHLVPHQTAA